VKRAFQSEREEIFADLIMSVCPIWWKLEDACLWTRSDSVICFYICQQTVCGFALFV